MKAKSDKKQDKNVVLVTELRVQLARTLADYDNLRKRVEAEKETWFRLASSRIIGKLLPILDNLENMQKHLNDQGLAITIGEFKKILAEEGLKEIKPLEGDTFDENKMEAVEVVDGGQKNSVCELVLSGWESEDDVVRHARVKVFK